MKLHSLLRPEFILTNLKSEKTEDILGELVSILKEHKAISNENSILNKLLEREKLGSTSIGNFSAVPHTKIKDLKNPIISLGVSRKGIQYHENDEKPVHFIILVLSPAESSIIHLQILAAAASLVKKSTKLIKDIRAISDSGELMKIIKKYEASDEKK